MTKNATVKVTTKNERSKSRNGSVSMVRTITVERPGHDRSVIRQVFVTGGGQRDLYEAKAWREYTGGAYFVRSFEDRDFTKVERWVDAQVGKAVTVAAFGRKDR